MRAILIACVLMAYSNSIYSQACCCSSAGGNYNILPNLDKHLVGLRYSYSHYGTTVYPMDNMQMNGMDMEMMGNGQAATETIHTIDVTGRFNLPKRLQLSVFLPVHAMTEKSATTSQRNWGLGDMSFILQYAVFDTRKCNGKPLKHQLRFGTGIKLPSGQFKMTPDGMFATDLQMGTGSVDFLFNTVYTLRYKKLGFNVSAAYKKNTTNTDQFRFGDKLRFGLNAFYVFKLNKDITVMPTLGTNFDHVFFNHYKKAELNYTGGEYLDGSAGLDVYWKHIAVSASIAPVLYSVSNWSGEPIPHFTVETGLYYSF